MTGRQPVRRIALAALFLAAHAAAAEDADAQLEATALARILTAAPRGRAPTPSVPLERAARDLARRAARGEPHPLAAGSVRRAVAEAGAFDPAPVALLVAAPQGDAAEALGQPDSLRGATHIGIGAAVRAGTAWVVLVAVERRAEIDPFPRQVRRGTDAALRGRLIGLSRPRVFVGTPSGWAREVPVREAAGSFEAGLSFDEDGWYRVEVLGEGRGGPAVAALLDVASGAAGPRAEDVRPVEPAVANDVEGSIRAAIDDLRIRRGLAPLRWDERVSDLARRHSAAMAGAHAVAHVLGDGGDVTGRLRTASVPFRHAFENVARGEDALDAHRAAEASPAHLANLLAPQAEVAGVGIARGRLPGGQLSTYLTEVLLEPVDDGAASALTPEGRVKEAIAAERARLGLAPLEADAALDGLAREAARAMLRREDPAPGDLQARAAALRAPSGSARGQRVAAADGLVVTSPAAAARSRNVAERGFRRFGVGAVRGDSTRFGAGLYWIAVVYAE